MLKAMSSWSSTRILREHRHLVRLVSKVRRRLEHVVDTAPTGWMPDSDFAQCFAAVVGGGARLCDSYYKREKVDRFGGVSDEDLDRKIQKELRVMLEEAPLEELETIVRRKRMELRQGKAKALPPDVIDVEAP